jgi:hypothetical protein
LNFRDKEYICLLHTVSNGTIRVSKLQRCLDILGPYCTKHVYVSTLYIRIVDIINKKYTPLSYEEYLIKRPLKYKYIHRIVMCNTCYTDIPLLNSLNPEYCSSCVRHICVDCLRFLKNAYPYYLKTRYPEKNGVLEYCTSKRCFSNILSRIFEMQSLHVENKKDDVLYTTMIYLQNGYNSRKHELRKALKAKGLKLRRDSSYCKYYMYRGGKKIEDVVNRMCQMKYLFEYYDFNNKLYDMEERRFNGYEPESSVFEEAELDILEIIGGYPEIYPWQIKRMIN